MRPDPLAPRDRCPRGVPTRNRNWLRIRDRTHYKSPPRGFALPSIEFRSSRDSNPWNRPGVEEKAMRPITPGGERPQARVVTKSTAHLRTPTRASVNSGRKLATLA